MVFLQNITHCKVEGPATGSMSKARKADVRKVVAKVEDTRCSVDVRGGNCASGCEFYAEYSCLSAAAQRNISERCVCGNVNICAACIDRNDVEPLPCDPWTECGYIEGICDHCKAWVCSECPVKIDDYLFCRPKACPFGWVPPQGSKPCSLPQRGPNTSADDKCCPFGHSTVDACTRCKQTVLGGQYW